MPKNVRIDTRFIDEWGVFSRFLLQTTSQVHDERLTRIIKHASVHANGTTEP
jgi:hypothetical protein